MATYYELPRAQCMLSLLHSLYLHFYHRPSYENLAYFFYLDREVS